MTVRDAVIPNPRPSIDRLAESIASGLKEGLPGISNATLYRF